jgi:Flp pilus assembly protein TadG
MMFALVVIPLAAVVGLAVDFGRAYAVRSQTQSALDAAALAAGRVAQVDADIAKASAAATAYFEQGKPKGVVRSTMQFSPNSQNTAFTVTATSWVRTPFLGALNILFNKTSIGGAPGVCQGSYFNCAMVVTTATSELKAGGDGGSNIEVSLMLDVTGSMCMPCTKIDDAKDAAKDLIDIVIWQDQSQYTSKIALAPFADAVNVGTARAIAVRGPVTSNNSNSPQVLSCSNMSSTSVQPTRTWIRFPRTTNNCNSNSSTSTYQISTKCVTERIGAQALTDAAPAGTSTYLGKGYFGTNDTTCAVASNYGDAEINTIQPLSNDKTMLKRRIDKLETGGSTAGHLGTAWAWYLLSPKWNTVLTSTAGPYSDLTSVNAKGAPKLRKIAVLLTDGEYNINYCKGVEAKNSDQSPDINCNSENGKSLAQATSLCTALKNPLGTSNAAKIEVFTVGFQVTNASKTFLKNCATDASHFYDASTGDALKAAFRDIALKISTLRLTN